MEAKNVISSVEVFRNVAALSRGCMTPCKTEEEWHGSAMVNSLVLYQIQVWRKVKDSLQL